MDDQYAYLGAVLVDPSTLDAHPLGLEDFTGACRGVFKAMQKIHNSGFVPDVSTLIPECPEWKQVGLEILTWQITAANAGYYAKRLRNQTKLRCFASIGPLVTQMQEDGETVDTIGAEINRYLSISERGAANGVQIGESIRRGIKNIERQGIRGLTTGYRQLDRALSGLQPSGLYIVAGRPGMGKSAWAGNLCETLGAVGKKIIVFSLEMDNEQWAMRMVYSQGRVDSGRANDGALTQDDCRRIAAHGAIIAGWDVKIYDQPSIKVDYMRSITRREKPDLVIIDYLQLAKADAEKRHEEVAEISRGLKALAKENRIPVVALAQMNRGNEMRDKKRPVLSDLRESGQIEQDADAVLFLYRPAYYCQKCQVDGDCGEDGHGTTAEIILAKNRHGKSGIILADYYGENFRFEERRYERV
jgi:replicative DNA helicase